MARAFIALGANEGDRLAQLFSATCLLRESPDVRVVQLAPIIETEPVGGPPQADYLNSVVEVETALDPDALLRLLQDIERRLGRAPSAERWGPRPIDLDLLLYDDRIITQPHLCVPHPRMHQRRFVLEPLAQLAPGLLHPILHQPIAALLEQLTTGSAA